MGIVEWQQGAVVREEITVRFEKKMSGGLAFFLRQRRMGEGGN